MANAENTTKNPEGFTAAERAAMKERAKELRAEAKGEKARADGDRDVRAKIAEMPKSDSEIALQVHELVTETAPELIPKLWYGMPSYARDGKIVCFFQDAAKFDSRYPTLGFNDTAKLDDGTMWPTAFALTDFTAANKDAIRKLVEKAVS